jgi:hypothetical protein
VKSRLHRARGAMAEMMGTAPADPKVSQRAARSRALAEG